MPRVLVAYFSASGTTGRVAEKLAQAAGADLCEIKPREKYTAADLNWNNPSSRSSVEMNDPTSRPELSDYDANVGDYDVVFVGFPIWWYTAPHIINRFLESYDFKKKKIVFYATSGGSGIAQAVQELASQYPDLTIVGGELLSSNASVESLQSWLDSLDL